MKNTYKCNTYVNVHNCTLCVYKENKSINIFWLFSCHVSDFCSQHHLQCTTDLEYGHCTKYNVVTDNFKFYLTGQSMCLCTCTTNWQNQDNLSLLVLKPSCTNTQDGLTQYYKIYWTIHIFFYPGATLEDIIIEPMKNHASAIF